MNDSDKNKRLQQFGKCCWTCANTECVLSQINNQPPHEAGEGRNCEDYIVYGEPEIKEGYWI